MEHKPMRSEPRNHGESEFSNFHVSENGFLEKDKEKAFEFGREGKEKE